MFYSLLIAVTALLCGAQTSLFKYFNLHYMKNKASYFLFNFISCTFIALILPVTTGGVSVPELFTIILGLSFGITFILTVFFYTKAMELGPLSFTSMFFSSSLLLPISAGWLLWQEPVTLIQIIGVGVLLAAYYLATVSNTDEKRKANFRWLQVCLLAFIGNGSLAILSKLHQHLIPQRQINEYLIIAFGTSAIISLFLFLLQTKVRKEDITHLKNPGFVLIALSAGAATGFANQLIIYLMSFVPSIVLFPCVNGGLMLVSILLSVILFGEKLTQKSIAGLVLGVTALILLSLH